MENPQRDRIRRLVAEKIEALELLALARKRERALINGDDELVPLGDVMREYGLEHRSSEPAKPASS